MKILIDPGHGKDSGAFYEGIKESELNLAISKKLGIIINCSDNEDVATLTRYKDEFLELKQRTDIEKHSYCDMFISIHCNAAKSRSARGFEICYLSKNGRKIAERISKRFDMLGLGTNRGLKKRDDLYVLKHTKSPAILIECGFMSNTEDLDNLTNNGYQWHLAACIYQGIKNL